MAARNLIGNYSIPQTLVDELERENKIDDSISSDQLKENITKNDYVDRKYKRKGEISLDDSSSTYRGKMEVRELEREEERVRKLIKEKQEDGIQPSPKRQRKKRWDVTPEEYAKNNSIVLDSSSITSSALIETPPIINGIALVDSILNKILPSGYKILPFPKDYQPFDANLPPDLIEAPTSYYVPPSTVESQISDKTKLHNNEIVVEFEGMKDIEYFKEEDVKYFGKLSKVTENDSIQTEEQKLEIRFMRLLLKVKNGSQIARKRSLRQITDNARKFGPKIIFDQVLPILLEPNLDDQERHLLVKLIGRILFQLDDLIRPYTHKILIVISPLLIDEDFTTRLEARDIISSLSKAAGLSNMISNLRPDLDHVDEFVRNTTSRVFAIVANTLGLVNFLPFLKAVIKSKKNWTARHTGIKIIQQLCIILGGGNGNSILPFLEQLIEVLKPGLTDEVLQVRTITALAISQLADNVKPYGIDAFEPILEPVLLGLKRHRGKGLANFLKCIGSIIPLMHYDPNYEEYSNYYSRELMAVISREFQSPDEDMKKTILRILTTLPLSKEIIPNYPTQIFVPFFKAYWNRRVASDSNQLFRLVVEATTQLAIKFDLLEVLENIVGYAKDENENLRRMSVDSISEMIRLSPDGLLGLDSQLELTLIDSVLYAFQEQQNQSQANNNNKSSRVYLQGLSTVCQSLGIRLKPHMNSIISTILYRLKNKSPEVRQQASDLISAIAPVIKVCYNDDNEILMKLILILYESLGEVYPEVLGSILLALYACIDSIEVISLFTMQNPSINQILPTLTPILKNRQDKVQESCIKLVGLIAKKNAESINAKEWMRVCFELLDMLKSSKKRIRVASNETFGHIAKTIGPQDVLAMLLNNLRVQERQLRVCTAVAIGIVAENCAPFTVLPSLMNEYRIPDKNVQNGVLKAMSFLFEYLDGSVTKDYLYAITPLLEDALTDRDLVHRQTASSVVQKIAINCFTLIDDKNYELFIHFLNLIIPNIYETSPHVINRIFDSMDSIRVSIGAGVFMNYIWAGLFHPARKVRAPFWKAYNRAYIQNSDVLVPCYPILTNIEDKSYEIEELSLIL
ncbi:U2 snRNP component Hsh155p [[Candida] railenensis]|uniref:U2 snRNP component Hsh155p n=1 Tax=[Candida] railenensis TaxID=45579 RepID=A0A9P0QUD7_9ASCO|nr:U2 snRNP component Hsh155p [[Candida] railenensis]